MSLESVKAANGFARAQPAHRRGIVRAQHSEKCAVCENDLSLRIQDHAEGGHGIERPGEKRRL
jgi:hypothetical protein